VNFSARIPESIAREAHQLSDVLDAVRVAAGETPQLTLEFDSEAQLLWITLRPEPKPVFTLQIIDSVRKVQGAIMRLWPRVAECPIRFLAYRSVGSIFSLGGDLDFYLDCLASNDRASLARYADLAADVIRLNATGLDGLVLTLSTIQGKALGGGIDPARACNIMIAEESATFGYPEVNYNHFPISAVPILSRHTGLLEAQRILLSGADYTAADFHKVGALNAVVPDGTGEEWVRKYALKTAATQRARVILLGVFTQRAGDLDQELSAGAAQWVDHMLTLTPLEISKLQRIAHAQEKLLARLSQRNKA